MQFSMTKGIVKRCRKIPKRWARLGFKRIRRSIQA